MKLTKEELGLLYMCVKDEMETYTPKDIREDGVKYFKLNDLASKIEKVIELTY